MSKEIHSTQTCTTTMKLIGDYWTLRIIDVLKNGEVRFCELQRHLDNVNPVTLTSKLKKLETTNIVKRSEEADKISVSYSLTSLGKEALPVVRALYNFSEKTKAL